jgi:hypothetical protein
LNTSADMRSRLLELGRRYAAAERTGDPSGMTAAESEFNNIDREIAFDAGLRAIFDEGRASFGA